METRSDTRGRAVAIACVAAAFAAGLGLRLWGMDVGLPFPYHDSENALVSRAVRMPLDGPDPHWFRYPTLYFYIQAAVFYAHFLALALAGAVDDYRGYYEAFLDDPSRVYLLGRTVNGLLAAATAVFTARAARWLGSGTAPERRAVAVVAAFFVALNAPHVERSHFITTDIPLTLTAALLLVLTGAMAARSDGGSLRQYALSGALIGLAASFKYPGALLCLLTVFTYALSARASGRPLFAPDARLPVAAAVSIAVFLIGSPFVLLNYREFARDFRAEVLHMEAGHLGFEGASSGWVKYLQDLTAYGEVGLVVFFVAGAALLFRRDLFGRAVVLTVLVYFAIAGTSKAPFLRYLLPMLPLAALVAGHGLVAAASAGARLLGREAARPAFVAALLAAALAFPAYVSYHRLRIFAADSTRERAWAWAEALGAGSAARPRVAAERKSLPSARRQAFDWVPVAYDFDRLQRQGVEYVALNSNMYRRHLRAAEDYPDQARFYARVLAEGEEVAVFSPFPDDSDRIAVGPSGAPEVKKGLGRAAFLRNLRHRRLDGPVIAIYRIPAIAGAPVDSAPADAVPEPEELSDEE